MQVDYIIIEVQKILRLNLKLQIRLSLNSKNIKYLIVKNIFDREEQLELLDIVFRSNTKSILFEEFINILQDFQTNIIITLYQKFYCYSIIIRYLRDNNKTICKYYKWIRDSKYKSKFENAQFEKKNCKNKKFENKFRKISIQRNNYDNLRVNIIDIEN